MPGEYYVEACVGVGDKEYVARGEPIVAHPSLQIVLFGIIHLKAEFERSIDWHCPYQK